jgi:hypothetical protein
MKIFICASKHFYNKVADVKEYLEANGHTVTLPNSYDNPLREEELKSTSKDDHITWKAEMLRKQGEKVEQNDAIVVLNFEKNSQANYIGGATFLEIFKAFELGKKIYLYNPIPTSILTDELVGINPLILNGDLSKIQ